MKMTTYFPAFFFNGCVWHLLHLNPFIFLEMHGKKRGFGAFLKPWRKHGEPLVLKISGVQHHVDGVDGWWTTSHLS